MRILAVAVTYNPEIALLAQVLEAVSPQVQGLVVVDNGSANVREIRRIVTGNDGQIIEIPGNIGIAAAQNKGVSRARDDGFTHVLLLDQDTVLAPGMVRDLADHLDALTHGSEAVAAIGPAYFELNSRRQTRAYRADRLRVSRLPLDAETRPVASDFIIASGSLVPLSVLEAVGGFKEDLFIDLVDVEWCFRARAAGYRSYLSPTAAVEHRLGSGTVQIGARQVAVHVPIRNYYWVRNALWLARQPYTPLAWRLYFISRSLAFLGTYTVMADKRALRLKLILRGIRDSVAGRLGPLGG
ncbi:glycosyltransferase family 2 protein [Microvirga mediterraneensis]|uniref:Glycosyltransferase family 2 protein n=1 Tax=Microvirga mediterraneensis TaxID=2754695 RepID=A0A838BQZ9_9HYPH|nr:glycosyltransferase family 2 protein [Microvirga mediterraneensis]MBA1158194.1 glycosyltransferase family 2 protein [Microvirga mediterraneensis]